MTWLIDNWEAVVFLCSVVIWLILWRLDAKHWNDLQRRANQELIEGVREVRRELAENAKESRQEHAALMARIELGHKELLNENHDQSKTLTKIDSHLNMHIEEQRK